MYIIWNAIKNLGRNKGRNILIAVIIFVIIAVTAVSIIINTTTAAITKDYKDRFGSEITIRVKSDVFSSGREIEYPTSRQMLEFGKSEYLKTAEYTTRRGGMVVDDLDADPQSNDGQKLADLIGSSKEYISQEFNKGTWKMKDGEKYQNTDECIISEEFAKKNNLSIGDTITVDLDIIDLSKISTGEEMTGDFERLALKITGIFGEYGVDENGAQYGNQMARILVHSDTLLQLESFQMDEELQVEGTFFLKDPEMLESFTKELRSKGLSDAMEVLTDEDGYKQVVGPVEGLSKTATAFLIAVLVLGCGILLVISVLTIRERKYEIGVLRAMGMKKAKIAAGLLTETILITALCLVIGLGAGTAVSQPVADYLLADQVKIAQENSNDPFFDSGYGELDKAEYKPLSEVDVGLTAEAILQIIVIALMIAGASSTIGIFYIMRYEPMRILSERN